MANFTVAGVAVRADGWSADVTLTGLAGQQGAITYDFGTPGSTSTGNAYMRVTSEGYNAAGTLGTVERYVYFTKAVRLPYPNEASLDETDSGSDLVVRVALSDWVYNDDKDGGAGTSGTDILVVCQSGTFTNGADVNEAYNSSATNNSTQDYPKAFGQWATVPFQAFTSDPTLKFTARHRHKIAAVKFTLTDASLNSVNGFATSEVSNMRAVSGLYACEYEKSLSLTTLTQGEVLTGNAIIYPVVGDADSVFDTATATVNANNTALGQCNYSFYNNKTGAATVTRYVNGATGNDTTGDGSSGNPWATINKALQDATTDDIEVASGTYAFHMTSTPAALNRWKVVRPASGATVYVQADDGASPYLAAVRTSIKFDGVTIQKKDASAWFYDSTGAFYLWYNNCTFDNNSQGANGTAPGMNYQCACAFMTGCTVDNAYAWGMWRAPLAGVCPLWMDGNNIVGVTNESFDSWVRIVANDVDDFGVYGNANAIEQDPGIVEFNRLHSFSAAGSATIKLVDIAALDVGISFTGNVVERTATTSPALEIQARGTTDLATNHVIVWHNTVTGERVNLAYNSNGTAAVNQLLWSVVGNSFNQYNIKSDLFGTASGNRVGNWANLHGVGYVANGSESSIGFNNAYPGLYSDGIMHPAGDEGGTDASICVPNYTTDASYTGTAAGDGDYLPSSPSDIIEALPAGWAMVPYDLYGKPIGNSGEGEIGGVQLAPAPTVSDVSPASIAKGATADITLTGTGFVDGISAASNYAAEFAVNTTTWNSATEVVVNVTGGSGTAGSYLDALTLTNPDGQTVDVALTLTAATGGNGGAGVSSYISAPGKQKYRRVWWEE